MNVKLLKNLFVALVAAISISSCSSANDCAMASDEGVAKIKELIKAHMPNLKKKAEKSEAAEWVFNGCKDYLSSSKKGMVLANVDACLNSGIITPAAFLSNIMFLETGIRFSAYNDAEDYDVSAGVVMFEENFPWLMTEFEKNMTKQVLDDVFAKYIAELGMDVSPDNICIDTDI